MLSVNTSLEILELSNDSIDEEGVEQLLRSLDFNKTVRLVLLPRTTNNLGEENLVDRLLVNVYFDTMNL